MTGGAVPGVRALFAPASIAMVGATDKSARAVEGQVNG